MPGRSEGSLQVAEDLHFKSFKGFIYHVGSEYLIGFNPSWKPAYQLPSPEPQSAEALGFWRRGVEGSRFKRFFLG